MALITRGEWGARPPRNAPTRASFTEPVTAHWHGPNVGWPFDHSRCFEIVRSIQAFHMDSRGWNDIAYNGLPCPHGDVFEGRGPGIQSAANGTTAANAASPALCFIAGEGDEFTDASKRAFLDGCEWLGQPPGHVHRDWFSTSCPGDERAAWIAAGCPIQSQAVEEPEVTGPAVITWPRFGGDEVHVFITGTDHCLWHKWWLGDAGQWSDWQNLGGQLSSGPAASSASQDRIDVCARGIDGSIWHIWWNGLVGAWSGWESLGGQAA